MNGYANAGCSNSIDVRSSFSKVTLIGKSAAQKSIESVAQTVADRYCTVVILGETGTGKELLARYLHSLSSRRDAPFIPVDCSALSETLFESEMFGHVRGAFTGAVRDSLGFIRAAEGGTLFLDEIGELPAAMQSKLLRVIQERCVVPVGDVTACPVDVRIVAATHRDLQAMVRSGELREDLFFRLNVVVMTLPPLRERREDVVPLAAHFLRLQAELYDEPRRRLSPLAAEALRQYSWPGNIRELANVMESAHVMASGETVELEALPRHIRVSKAAEPVASDLCLCDVERRTIIEALRRTNYCKAAASRLLGINVQRLNRHIAKLKIPASPAC